MFHHSTVRRSLMAAAVTVALPLMLASSAAASAGQQAAGDAPDSAAATTNVAQVLAPPSQAVVSAAAEASCELLGLHCIVRLDRETTRRARDSAELTSAIIGPLCDVIPLAVVKVACKAAIGSQVRILAKAARDYYADGDCLAVNVVGVPGAAQVVYPSRVKRGDHNCS